MPESAAQVYQRIVDAVGEDGRLATPSFAAWDIFPWEVVEGRIAPRVVAPPGAEPARAGETAERPCSVCAGIDADLVVWEDENWVLTHLGQPSGLPLVLMLQPREHHDFGELDDDLASEYGRISNRLVRIIENLPEIGRVHVNRWGDGGSHFHVWFFARTRGLPNVLGSPAAEWDGIIPPGPEAVWREDLRTVATKLANWGGEARA